MKMLTLSLWVLCSPILKAMATYSLRPLSLLIGHRVPMAISGFRSPSSVNRRMDYFHEQSCARTSTDHYLIYSSFLLVSALSSLVADIFTPLIPSVSFRRVFVHCVQNSVQDGTYTKQGMTSYNNKRCHNSLEIEVLQESTKQVCTESPV